MNSEDLKYLVLERQPADIIREFKENFQTRLFVVFLMELITNIKVPFILLPLLDQLFNTRIFYPKDSY